MYFTIYKTTNKITSEFYIGQHVTEHLDDGYLGSGPGILDAVKQYGRLAFEKDIMYVFDNEDEMNAKEKELVDSILLENPLCLNRQEGGSGGWFVRGSIVVFENGRWRRIRKSQYDRSVHVTPTSGTLKVFDSELSVFRRIPSEEYHNNKDRYSTATTGRVSVRNKETNFTVSISSLNFDPKIHKSVFGGIVAEVNGTRQYVTREQFIADGLSGCHTGKVTVVDKTDGSKKHITKDEYHNNKDRYDHNTKGRLTVFDAELNKFCMITLDEYQKNSDRYKATTSGQKTVWVIEERRFKNIPAETFDRKYHRLAGDKKIMCYNLNGDVIFEHWGTKGDFIKKYGHALYNQAVSQTQNYQPKHRKFAAYTGCSFKLIDWSNQK